MRPLSFTMLSLLTRIAEHEPDGYPTWPGRTTDALERRGLVDWEPMRRRPGSSMLIWKLTDAGRKALGK